MDDTNEVSIELIEDWVLDYLKCCINKGKPPDYVYFIESALFYARDQLFELGLKNKDGDLINQAKAITCLVNFLREQPSVNNWNGLLKNHGLAINKLVFVKEGI